MDAIAVLTVVSAAFLAGAPIPLKHAGGKGGNVSPPLSWNAPPAGTQSLTVICDDPDAPVGNWTHWVLFNLSPDTVALPAGVPPRGTLPNGAIQGVNDYRKLGYDGPWPPPGAPHRYCFTVYALDRQLELAPGATKAAVLAAMRGHVLTKGSLPGVFGR
ncbi:MAG: YbhB/YbcL family Raf kinase inhibitor-like protein [Lentisphaeria bacterium]